MFHLFQSQCNFVQLLQVFIKNLMRLSQRTEGEYIKDEGEEEEGFQCLSTLLQLCFELLCHSVAKA